MVVVDVLISLEENSMVQNWIKNGTGWMCRHGNTHEQNVEHECCFCCWSMGFPGRETPKQMTQEQTPNFGDM